MNNSFFGADIGISTFIDQFWHAIYDRLMWTDAPPLIGPCRQLAVPVVVTSALNSWLLAQLRLPRSMPEQAAQSTLFNLNAVGLWNTARRRPAHCFASHLFASPHFPFV